MNKKLNILIIPSWYPSEMDPNGVPYIRVQAQALARAGHRVTVVFTQAYSLRTVAKQKRLMFGTRKAVVEGVTEIHSYFPKTHIRRIDEMTRLIQGKRLLRKWTREEGLPDLVHVHVYMAGALGVWYHKNYKVPLVTTEHFTGFARNILKPWEMKRARKLYTFSSLNLAVSRSFANILWEKTGVSFEVLSNMVNTEEFYPSDRSESENYTYLFVGSLHDKKNPTMLLEAFIKEHKKDPSLRLILAGEGVLMGALKNRVAEEGITDAVSFPGFLRGEDVAKTMRCADAFVLPSRFETFGIVVVEAMASGLPVIMTRCGGVDSHIIDGENGCVIEQDESRLREAMNFVCSRKWDKEKIRNYALDNFSEQVVVAKLVGLYEDILNKPHVFQACRGISTSGGISKVAYHLAYRLTERGYRVSSFTANLDESSLRNDIGKTVVIPVPVWIQRMPRYFYNYLKTRHFTKKVHSVYKHKNKDPHTVTISHRDSYGADIAIGHSCHREAVQVKKQDGRRFWWLNPIHRFYQKQENRIFRKPWPVLVAISHAIAKEHQKHYGIPEKQIHTIANGVDISRFHPELRNENRDKLIKEFSLPQDAFVLLFVGHEFKRKGLEHVLGAMALGSKETYLFVLGMADKRYYEQKAEKLGINTRVFFTGHRKDTPLFYTAADLFILPSDYEPFGLVGIEALSSGTPILMPALGGFLDYLKDGENGYFIQRKAEDIAEKIAIISKNRNLWQQMSLKARETALEYSWERIIGEYAKLVDDIARNKKF